MYGCMSLMAPGTLSGRVEPLIMYGPEGATAALIASVPSTDAM